MKRIRAEAEGGGRKEGEGNGWKEDKGSVQCQRGTTRARVCASGAMAVCKVTGPSTRRTLKGNVITDLG